MNMTREEQINAVAVSNAIEFRNNLIKEKVDKNIAKMYSNIALSYFEKGAEYADRTMIDKACKWLIEHKEAVETEDNGIMGWIPDYFIEDFRRAMEG